MMLHKLLVAATALIVATEILSLGTDAAILRGTIDCGAPPPVHQGEVSYSSTKMDAKAKYKCIRGTTMQGSANTICTKFGTWSQAAPSCIITYTRKNDNTYKHNDAGYRLYSG